MSALCQLKTYLWSTMDQERLSGLALMHIKYNMDLDLWQIINLCKEASSQKMLFASIVGHE